jgi:hypothetical protein
MDKTVAIMQPYFLPYIGYWQLFSIVDEFVAYDNIKYTKKGWINRNRYLHGDNVKYFTIPLDKDSDFRDICERTVSKSFDKSRLLNQLKAAYINAPYFNETYGPVEEIVRHEELNLFRYIFNSIQKMAAHLGISMKITISSDIDADHNLKSGERVIAICKALNATKYINPIGGLDLYESKVFLDNGIKLGFLKTGSIAYNQSNGQFIPSLSIIDVLMFNGRESTKKMLRDYNIIN